MIKCHPWLSIGIGLDWSKIIEITSDSWNFWITRTHPPHAPFALWIALCVEVSLTILFSQLPGAKDSWSTHVYKCKWNFRGKNHGMFVCIFLHLSKHKTLYIQTKKTSGTLEIVSNWATVKECGVRITVFGFFRWTKLLWEFHTNSIKVVYKPYVPHVFNVMRGRETVCALIDRSSHCSIFWNQLLSN